MKLAMYKERPIWLLILSRSWNKSKKHLLLSSRNNILKVFNIMDVLISPIADNFDTYYPFRLYYFNSYLILSQFTYFHFNKSWLKKKLVLQNR
jgi:hypothetical protein